MTFESVHVPKWEFGNEPKNFNEEAWIVEAERRYKAYKEGKMESRDVSLVLRDAHKELNKELYCV